MKKRTITINPKKSPEKVRRPSEREVLLGEGGPSEAGYHNAAPFMRCLKAGQLEVVRGVTKPMVQVPSHFAKGTLHHAMRARWFYQKCATPNEKAWQQILKAAEDAAEKDRLPVNPKDMRAAVALFSAYVDHWSKLPLPKPIAAEYLIGPPPEAVKFDPEGKVLYRTARLDDVSYYPGADTRGLYLGESKTTSGSPLEVLREYELHGQVLTQAVLWKLCPEGEKKYGPIDGVMLDVTKKPEGGDKPAFMRAVIRITPWMIDGYIRGMKQILAMQYAITWDSDAPRNYTGCTYMAGRARIDCTYKDLCRFGKDVTAKYIMKDGSSLRAHRPTKGKMRMPWE